MSGAQFALIGRQRELGELVAAFERAAAGRGRVIVVAGEPGIGKSRLADELAADAASAGATTAWGRCWNEGSVPPFWPWVQALGQITGAEGTNLDAFVPDVPGVPELESEQGRFLVFDAVTRLLRRSGESAPLVIVLDDFHLADAPTRALLRFVARLVNAMRVLIVATSRETSDLPDDADVVRLDGLDTGATGELVRATADPDVTAAVISAVHDATGGNPFFVRELSRLMADSPGARLGALPIPDTVRDVARRRLAPLSPPARALLDRASVYGQEFDVALIDADPALLAEAEDHGLLARSGVDAYAFSHAILRESVYADLAVAQRQQLHLEAAAAISRRERGDSEAAAVAYHQVAAGPLADPDHVLVCVTRAARHAFRAHAYEDAVGHFETARRLLETHHRDDESAACRLLLELGAAHAAAGDKDAAQRTFDDAVELARRVGSPEQLALAALGRAGDIPPAGTSDPRIVAMLEEAARGVAATHAALHARLLARVAIELYFTHDLTRRDELSRAALAGAEATGDVPTIVAALYARHYALFGPDDLDGRLATATALLDLATKAGSVEWMLQAHWWRVSDLLEKGDIIDVDRELAVWSRLADQLGQPQYLWAPAMIRATRANLAGRIDECEQLAYQAQAIGQSAVPDHATIYFAAHFFSVRRWQGRLTELLPTIESLVQSMPQVPLWRCALAYMFSEMGRDIEARRELDFFADRDFVDIPADAGWLLSISLLADVCGWLGDARRARVLYDRMAPYRDRLMVAGFGGVSHASAARCLGVLASTAGDYDEAAAEFEAALAVNRRVGAAAWLAHTRLDFATMLLARDADGDAARAVTLLDDALVEFRQLGIDHFADKVNVLLESLDRPAAQFVALDVPVAAGESGAVADVIRITRAGRPARLSPTPLTSARFQREGDYWTIAYAGSPFRLRHAKGLDYIAALLAKPGRDVAAVDLGGDLLPASDAGPVLDAAARTAYRHRLTELQEERDEALSRHDDGRAARADDEIAFLQRELSAAVGLGGRSRTAGSTGERARVRVTKAIKAAMKRIEAEDPSLAHHLAGALHTGAACSYRPDPANPVTWELSS